MSEVLTTEGMGQPVAFKPAALLPLKGMRGAIARNMSAGWQAPRVAVGVEVNVQACQNAKPLAGQAKAPGLTPMVLCAVARTLARHPALNALMRPEGIERLSTVNLGLAVALAEGLAVPVIRTADQLSLSDMAEQVRSLGQQARSQNLPGSAYQGGGFTVTNLGMTGIDWFTPILNPPQVGILGLGRVVEKPIAVKGKVVLAPMMTLTLVFDHRAVDGYPAALFLADLKKLLEDGVP